MTEIKKKNLLPNFSLQKIFLLSFFPVILEISSLRLFHGHTVFRIERRPDDVLEVLHESLHIAIGLGQKVVRHFRSDFFGARTMLLKAAISEIANWRVKF